jgi:hypothetical protein
LSRKKSTNDGKNCFLKKGEIRFILSRNSRVGERPFPSQFSVKVSLEMFVHCDLCAEGCHTYLSCNRDPSLAPVAKIRNSIWKLLKRKDKVDADFIRNMVRIG